MNRQQMLEYAANAADIPWVNGGPSRMGWAGWNPLDSNDDAIKLATKVLNWPHMGRAFSDAVSMLFAVGLLPKDPEQATRMAVTYAAAQIGKAKGGANDR